MLSSAVTELEPVNLLIVDDRPSNLRSLEALLDRDDYNLVLARSGAEALAQVLRREFALILLDVAMPDMDGFEVAALIKQREQSMHIPIIFVTASMFEMEEILRGYTIGAVDYLRKPLDAHAVRSKVAVFVELFRQRKQIERQSERLREAELREQRLHRERAEEALRETESLYQLTCEEAPIGIAHANPDGQLVRGNRHLARLLDIPLDALFERPVEHLVVAAEAPAIVERLATLRAGGPAYRGEHQLASAMHGQTVWAELTLSALRDDTGQLRQIIVVANDITSRKASELERARIVRELREGIRTRDDFLALAAHELKTPATPLRLQTEGLLRLLSREDRPLERDVLTRRLETLHRATCRLESLVEHLLVASNLTVASLPLALARTDLVAVATEVVERTREEATRLGCSLALDTRQVEGGELVGYWDPLQLAQALNNLVANAIKYGAGHPVTIALEALPARARVSVIDGGVGIPRDALERIFERFGRFASLSHYGGFGLGLWIVRRIVEAHHGAVSVTSEPGVGSRFTVELPCVPPEPEAAP